MKFRFIAPISLVSLVPILYRVNYSVILPRCDIMDVACGVTGYQKRSEYPPAVSAVRMAPMLHLIPVICYYYQIPTAWSPSDGVKHTCTVPQSIL